MKFIPDTLVPKKEAMRMPSPRFPVIFGALAVILIISAAVLWYVYNGNPNSRSALEASMQQKISDQTPASTSTPTEQTYQPVSATGTKLQTPIQTPVQTVPVTVTPSEKQKLFDAMQKKVQ